MAFSWEAGHLYIFDICERASDRQSLDCLTGNIVKSIIDDKDESGLSTLDHEYASKMKLSNIYEDPSRRNQSISYQYDYNDAWGHSIELIGYAAENAGTVQAGKVMCLAVEGHLAVQCLDGEDRFESYKRRRPGFKACEWDREAVNRRQGALVSSSHVLVAVASLA
jgi:hypothetical protein